jgi:hypothetical protein
MWWTRTRGREARLSIDIALRIGRGSLGTWISSGPSEAEYRLLFVIGTEL